MATPPKESRPCLSIAQKIKTFNRLKHGITRKTILDETGIGLRSLERIHYRERFIERILKQEEEIRKSGNLNRKRKRKWKKTVST